MKRITILGLTLVACAASFGAPDFRTAILVGGAAVMEVPAGMVSAPRFTEESLKARLSNGSYRFFASEEHDCLVAVSTDAPGLAEPRALIDGLRYAAQSGGFAPPNLIPLSMVSTLTDENKTWGDGWSRPVLVVEKIARVPGVRWEFGVPIGRGPTGLRALAATQAFVPGVHSSPSNPFQPAENQVTIRALNHRQATPLQRRFALESYEKAVEELAEERDQALAAYLRAVDPSGELAPSIPPSGSLQDLPAETRRQLEDYVRSVANDRLFFDSPSEAELYLQSIRTYSIRYSISFVAFNSKGEPFTYSGLIRWTP
ncbi:MAG: hypothetical protein MH204_05915 [Fimbriimonadaceae bacterium]|nr:hypothetical protein [Fimbriimonadaceae bacterium]